MAVDLREQLQGSLGDAFRLERELGGGGMSRVFLARETALGRHVVIKVLLPELAAGVSIERFHREIQLAAQLQHPHIVPLLAAAESCGLPFFTMPFVAGESLRARLLREGELPVAEAVRVLRDVASALAYAHAQGIVHRDIKPDNVLLSHGVAVVTDFGVAKALTASSREGSLSHRLAGLTSLGIALGTPTYMAPEQASADPGMDHRVDLYAFGIMAYEMLTGQPPFAGRSPQAILGAHIAGLAEPVASRRPGLPPALAALVMKCLEKRPADRPQTAADIMATLDMLTTPSGGTVPVAAVRSGRDSGWRSKTAAALRRVAPAALALGAVGATAVWLWSTRGDPYGSPVAGHPVQPAESAEIGSVPLAGPPARPTPTVPAAPPAEETPAPPKPAPARPPHAAAAEPAPHDAVLVAKLRSEASSSRARAVTAGVGASALAPGDTALARADSLVRQHRLAEAAVQLSSAATLWAGAAAAERGRAEAEARAESARVAAERPAPPPPAAAPAPDPKAEIRELFDEYSAAIEARSLAGIRRVYPELTPQQARGWEQFFGAVSDVDVKLDLDTLDVRSDAAQARLSGVYVFTDAGTHRTQRDSVSFVARLRRDAGRWRIQSLR